METWFERGNRGWLKSSRVPKSIPLAWKLRRSENPEGCRRFGPPPHIAGKRNELKKEDGSRVEEGQEGGLLKRKMNEFGKKYIRAVVGNCAHTRRERERETKGGICLCHCGQGKARWSPCREYLILFFTPVTSLYCYPAVPSVRVPHFPVASSRFKL